MPKLELIDKLFGLPSDPQPANPRLTRTSERLSTIIVERQSRKREFLEKPLLAIPIFPDGNPYWGRPVSGTSVDLSTQDIGFELDAEEWYPAKALVIGVKNEDGSYKYAGIEVQGSVPLEDSRIAVGGRFGGLADEILKPENLTPAFHPGSMDFHLGIPAKVLDRWVELGILHSYLWDRVQLCPKCLGLPTFRKGCRSCGSPRTTNDRLIHHFACAHVGLLSDFDANGEIICPKCQARRLVVGADFEYVHGPHHCQDCHWNDMSLEEVGQCLRCGFRFPGHQSHQLELKGYHVNRLDPLALLPSS